MIPLFLIVSLSLAAQTPSVEAYLPMLTPSKRVEAAIPESGLQGRVHLLVTVDYQGQVKDAEVLFSTSISLTPLAISAMRQWQFNPVLRDGKPVLAYTDEMVSFHTPGKKITATSNPAEILAYTRLAELRKKFPRTDQQVLADFEQEENGADAHQRKYFLPKLAKAAWRAGAMDKASKYAQELLDTVGSPKPDWNSGNAIHDGNMVLGLVALNAGNVPQARQYLLEAGKTPGSPQANSFGPNMSLAKELAQKGEKETVLEYFALCRKFWKMGGERLDQWSDTVRANSIPDFGANLVY